MKWILAAAALVSIVPASVAQNLGEETSIGRIDVDDTVVQVKKYDDQTVFIQTYDLKWYRIFLAAPCPGLSDPKARIAYEGNHGVFDKRGIILLKGKRCPAASVIWVDAPPTAKPAAAPAPKPQ